MIRTRKEPILFSDHDSSSTSKTSTLLAGIGYRNEDTDTKDYLVKLILFDRGVYTAYNTLTPTALFPYAYSGRQVSRHTSPFFMEATPISHPLYECC